MIIEIEIPPRAYALVRKAAADSFGAEHETDLTPADVARWAWLNFTVDVGCEHTRPEIELLKLGASARYQRRYGDPWRPVRQVAYANEPPARPEGT